jgi:hypothetical protein
MNRQAPAPAITRLGTALCLGLALAACGGADDPDSSPAATQQPATGFALVKGQLVDASGAALGQAKVYMPFGRDQAWGADTDAEGRFTFQARASDFAGVSPVALVIDKPGYRPRSLYVRSVQAGSTYAVPTGAASAPAALGPGEYVPQGLFGLLHVGDDSFTGSANSQLQTRSRGRIVDFGVVTWSDDLKARYRQAIIEFAGRGLQGSTCTTQIGLAAFDPAAGVAIPRYTNPGDSDISGGFSSFALRLDVTGFPVGTPIRFVVMAGQCSRDLDDLEITDVVVRFVP